LKDESKRVSVRNSRASSAIFEPKSEEVQEPTKEIKET